MKTKSYRNATIDELLQPQSLDVNKSIITSEITYNPIRLMGGFPAVVSPHDVEAKYGDTDSSSDKDSSESTSDNSSNNSDANSNGTSSNSGHAAEDIQTQIDNEATNPTPTDATNDIGSNNATVENKDVSNTDDSSSSSGSTMINHHTEENPISNSDSTSSNTGTAQVDTTNTTENIDESKNVQKAGIKPRYFHQREFKNMVDENEERIFSDDFANQACTYTSLTNEFSEKYTQITGKQLTLDDVKRITKIALEQDKLYGVKKNGYYPKGYVDENAFVKNPENVLNLYTKEMDMDTTKKWKQNIIEKYVPNAGEHVVYKAILYKEDKNGEKEIISTHSVNNTDMAGGIFEVWKGTNEVLDHNNPMIWIWDSENKRSTLARIVETRIYTYE